MSDNTAASTMTYGTVNLDFASLPFVSQMALAKKGLAHFLGNEQASKVTTWKEKNTGADADAIAAAKADFIAEAVQTLIDGTVGHRAGTPRGTPIEAIMRQMALAEVAEILKANGLAMPSGDKIVKLGNTEYTRADLVARRLTSHGDRIRKDAEREMARRAKAAANTVAVDGAEGAEALGL